MSRKEQIQFLIIHSIGNFLVLFGLYIVYITFAPALSQEIRFRIEKAKGVTYTVKEKKEVSKGEEKKIQSSFDLLNAFASDTQDRILIPYDSYFSILIPKIGANSRVIPNVDPANEKEFRRVLLNGIAHAKGTVFPGMKGNVYLFAHSTDTVGNTGRYNAVFYLLKELEKGDEIVIFYQNVRYNYIITDSFTADPEDVSLFVNSRGEEQKVILQTCWPPGTTWKRLFIVAKPSLQGERKISD